MPVPPAGERSRHVLGLSLSVLLALAIVVPPSSTVSAEAHSGPLTATAVRSCGRLRHDRQPAHRPCVGCLPRPSRALLARLPHRERSGARRCWRRSRCGPRPPGSATGCAPTGSRRTSASTSATASTATRTPWCRWRSSPCSRGSRRPATGSPPRPRRPSTGRGSIRSPWRSAAPTSRSCSSPTRRSHSAHRAGPTYRWSCCATPRSGSPRSRTPASTSRPVRRTGSATSRPRRCGSWCRRASAWRAASPSTARTTTRRPARCASPPRSRRPSRHAGSRASTRSSTPRRTASRSRATSTTGRTTTTPARARTSPTSAASPWVCRRRATWPTPPGACEAADAAAAAAYVDGYLWFGRPWLFNQASGWDHQRALTIARTTPYAGPYGLLTGPDGWSVRLLVRPASPLQFAVGIIEFEGRHRLAGNGGTWLPLTWLVRGGLRSSSSWSSASSACR